MRVHRPGQTAAQSPPGLSENSRTELDDLQRARAGSSAGTMRAESALGAPPQET
jgi:hypothetical protein